MPLGLQNAASRVRKYVTFRTFRHATSSVNLRVAQSTRCALLCPGPPRPFKTLRKFVCWVLLMFFKSIPVDIRACLLCVPAESRPKWSDQNSLFLEWVTRTHTHPQVDSGPYQLPANVCTCANTAALLLIQQFSVEVGQWGQGCQQS